MNLSILLSQKIKDSLKPGTLEEFQNTLLPIYLPIQDVTRDANSAI